MNLNFSYTNSLIDPERIKNTATSLSDYAVELAAVVDAGNYDHDAASLVLPRDKSNLEIVGKVAAEKSPDKIKFIVLIGIGGSNLGTQAVYEALNGTEHNFTRSGGARILFLDTTAAKKTQNLLSLLENECNSPEELLIIAISKSGGTTETVAGLEFMNAKLSVKFPQLTERMVFISDEGSPFWNMAEQNGISVLPLPKKVGGRYSVLSAVGLLPLKLAGVDTEMLLQGAEEVCQIGVQASPDLNMPMVSAVLTYLHSLNGLKINNSFFFNPELEAVGRWYRQLMGESIGKQNNLEGEEVHSGITPVVSIGSTDLHSMAQLYFGGPRDKFTTLVYHSQKEMQIGLPEKLRFEGLVKGIAGKSFPGIMDAIYGGVKAAYLNNKLPFTEISLEQIDAKTVGSLLQFKMIEMMYLAKLLNVNAFDQPNVEDYKLETKKLLEN